MSTNAQVNTTQLSLPPIKYKLPGYIATIAGMLWLLAGYVYDTSWHSRFKNVPNELFNFSAHWVLYGALIYLGVVLLVPFARNWARGYRWTFPIWSDFLFTAAVFIFLIGLPLDIIFHGIFGPDVGYPGLFSIPHQIQGITIVMAVTLVIRRLLHESNFTTLLAANRFHWAVIAVLFFITLILSMWTHGINPLEGLLQTREGLRQLFGATDTKIQVFELTEQQVANIARGVIASGVGEMVLWPMFVVWFFLSWGTYIKTFWAPLLWGVFAAILALFAGMYGRALFIPLIPLIALGVSGLLWKFPIFQMKHPGTLPRLAALIPAWIVGLMIASTLMQGQAVWPVGVYVAGFVLAVVGGWLCGVFLNYMITQTDRASDSWSPTVIAVVVLLLAVGLTFSVMPNNRTLFTHQGIVQLLTQDAQGNTVLPVEASDQLGNIIDRSVLTGSIVYAVLSFVLLLTVLVIVVSKPLPPLSLALICTAAGTVPVLFGTNNFFLPMVIVGVLLEVALLFLRSTGFSTKLLWLGFLVPTLFVGACLVVYGVQGQVLWPGYFTVSFPFVLGLAGACVAATIVSCKESYQLSAA